MNNSIVKDFVIRLVTVIGMFVLIPMISKLIPCLEGLLATMPSVSALLFYYSYAQFKDEGEKQAAMFAASMIPGAVFYVGMYLAIMLHYSMIVAVIAGLICWLGYGLVQQFWIEKTIAIVSYVSVSQTKSNSL